MYLEKKKEEIYLAKAIYAYGINLNVHNPFLLLDDNSIFYSIGTNGVVHNIIDKSQRFILSDENCYSIICLSISDDKKLLALGEISINKPFICIFTNKYKFIKKLILNISDNESKIMNISFSSKNKYLYCITNGFTKSLFLCYDWFSGKLIFSKIFPFYEFNKNCEIFLNNKNSSYIGLISTFVKNDLNNETNEDKLFDGGKELPDVGIDICMGSGEVIHSDSRCDNNMNKASHQLGRNIFLYHYTNENLTEIKIKNKKLDKINNTYTYCCWINDGILLLINKENYLIFYNIKKKLLKIYKDHIASSEILKVTCLSNGFILYDSNYIYFYECSNDNVDDGLNYLLKYYIHFNYNNLFNEYSLISSCERFIYFIGQDGHIKKLDIKRDQICLSNSNVKNPHLVKFSRGQNLEKGLEKGGEKNGEKSKTKIESIENNDIIASGKYETLGSELIKEKDDENSEYLVKYSTKDEGRNIETVLNNISSAKINDFDVCMKCPLIILCYNDNTIKIINYKKKKLVISNSFNNEPLKLSIHCSGHLLLVSFTDRLRLFHILYNKLKIKKELFLKNCSCCKFSNGGNLMAVSKISTIYIYKTYTYNILFVLKSHVNYITDIIWSHNDFTIFSIGKDGYLFEYSLYNNGNKNIEIMHKDKQFLSIDLETIDTSGNVGDVNNRLNNYNDMEQIKYDSEYKNNKNLKTNNVKSIYLSCNDKTIKQLCDSKIECVLESEYEINKILLYKNIFLICSYYNGFFSRIRFYVLPLCGIYLEIPCHISNCVNLKLDFNKELLFSCSKNGEVYIFSIEQIENCILFPRNLASINNISSEKVKQITSQDKKSCEEREINDQNKNENDNKYNVNTCTNISKLENTITLNDKLEVGSEKMSISDLAKDKNCNYNNTKIIIIEDNDKNLNNNGKDKNEESQDINSDDTLDGNREINYSFAIYDLNNKSKYILDDVEKESNDILIDFCYVEKKNNELLDLEKKIKNLKNQMELEMKNKESIYKNMIKKLKKEKDLELKNLMKINKNIIKEKEKMENKCKESLFELEEKHIYFVNQLNSQFYLTNKICEEKFLKIEEEFDLYKKNTTLELLELKKEHEIKMNLLIQEKNDEIQKKDECLQKSEEKYEQMKKEKDQYIKEIEDDVDEEILLLTKKYEEEIDNLKKDKYDLLGKFKLHEYIENELNEGINLEKDKFLKKCIMIKRMEENIESLKLDIKNLNDNIKSKDTEIDGKNKEIDNLKKRNREFEKLKIVLSQKIKDLESTLSPKDSEIKVMKDKIDEMSKCFENNHKKTINLQIEINEHKMKIKSLHDDVLNYNKRIGNYEKILKNLQDHIKECYLHLHDKKIFNSSFLNLYNKFHKINDVQNYDTKNVFSEYIRQKEYLENMIQVLKDKLEKETEAYRIEKIKMMNENSLLLKEINDLKMDLNFLKSEFHDAKLKNRKNRF
ncbi:WD repeat-containing protein 65, putative [Plasmodium berghei]|uniref:WD repeat-containing protein 65, putative n=1 Tax=Plasmodium berghei TaxID=5821 RepID=A0A0Y9XDK1_PLABE|nr:WD repeat-containing protein 65, putative [Plasmodium berghei]